MVSFPGSSALVGRAGDMSALLDTVGDEQKHTVLIAGEAGIGKSRLVGEFTRRLDPGALVLVGRCPEFGTGGVAFAPFLAVLRSLVRQVGVAEVAALLPPRPALANWLPQLAAHTGGGAPETDRIRLFGEILTLLEQLAMAWPVVLVLEDLHWADDASRELLTFLVANLADGEVLLIGTYRPGDAGPLRGLVAELRRNPGVRVFTLEPLTRHEVGRQLASLLDREPEPALITTVFERSGGNPLFVEALWQSPQNAPADLTDLLLGFQSGLSDKAREVLRVASVLGSPVRHDLLAGAADLAPDALHTALRELVDRQLLLATDTGYEFRHVLIRQAIYNDLLPIERTRLHTRIAEVLRKSPADESGADLAHHTEAARLLPESLAAYLNAAAAPTALPAERLRLLDHALGLWDRVPAAEHPPGATKLAVLEDILDAAVESGATERGIAAADTALALHAAAASTDGGVMSTLGTAVESGVAERGMADADVALALRTAAASTDGGVMSAPDGSAAVRAADDARVARLYRQRALLRSGTGVGPGDDLARALELLPAELPSLERAEVLLQLAVVRIFGGDTEGTVEDARAALAIAEQFGASALAARAHGYLGLASAARIDTALAHFRDAHTAAEADGDPRVLLDVLTWESAVLVAAGRYRAAITAAQRGLRCAHAALRFSDAAPILLVKWVQALSALGRWAEARDLVEEAEFEQLPPLSRAALRLCQGRIDLARGDAEAARAGASAAEELLGDAHWAFQYRLELRTLQCLLALESGDSDSAARILTKVAAVEEAAERLNAHPHEAWPLLVVAGRMPNAPGELIELADSLSIAFPIDAAYHAVFTARMSPSADRWQHAVEGWHTLERPYEEAETLLAAAGYLAAEGNRDAAHAALRTVLDLATPLGATPLTAAATQLATRARIALDRAPGESPNPVAANPSPRFGLTPRELDVLRLVAKGLSNRSLAAELFISANTAGVHVSRILTKLGVSTRTEAAAFAHEHDLL
ncbi:AAA family ATPase [Nocardia sp. NPDC051030]|uniref:helix-turn-helix transcriptional regulator n=1 Tax=Nocardia sp. NPDC051030 TaxID=3155162 RepID=UPI003434791D